MEQNDLENEKSMRDFLQKKYTKDIIIAGICLTAIVLSRSFGFITNDVTGTLLGATIGYSLAGLRKLHE